VQSKRNDREEVGTEKAGGIREKRIGTKRL